MPRHFFTFPLGTSLPAGEYTFGIDREARVIQVKYPDGHYMDVPLTGDTASPPPETPYRPDFAGAIVASKADLDRLRRETNDRFDAVISRVDALADVLHRKANAANEGVATLQDQVAESREEFRSALAALTEAHDRTVFDLGRVSGDLVRRMDAAHEAALADGVTLQDLKDAVARESASLSEFVETFGRVRANLERRDREMGATIASDRRNHHRLEERVTATEDRLVGVEETVARVDAEQAEAVDQLEKRANLGADRATRNEDLERERADWATSQLADLSRKVDELTEQTKRTAERLEDTREIGKVESQRVDGLYEDVAALQGSVVLAGEDPYLAAYARYDSDSRATGLRPSAPYPAFLDAVRFYFADPGDAILPGHGYSALGVAWNRFTWDARHPGPSDFEAFREALKSVGLTPRDPFPAPPFANQVSVVREPDAQTDDVSDSDDASDEEPETTKEAVDRIATGFASFFRPFALLAAGYAQAGRTLSEEFAGVFDAEPDDAPDCEFCHGRGLIDQDGGENSEVECLYCDGTGKKTPDVLEWEENEVEEGARPSWVADSAVFEGQTYRIKRRKSDRQYRLRLSGDGESVDLGVYANVALAKDAATAYEAGDQVGEQG